MLKNTGERTENFAWLVLFGFFVFFAASDSFITQVDNNVDGAGSRGRFHGLNISLPIFKYFVDCIGQGFAVDHFFGKKIAEALFFEGGSVENLVSAAGVGRQRN